MSEAIQKRRARRLTLPWTGRRRTDAASDVSAARFAVIAPLLWFVFLLFGGGGAPHAVMLVPLQLLGLFALLGLVFWHRHVAPITLPLWPSGILLGGMVLLGVAQLVPLPFPVWSALPGRELAAQIVREAGLPGKWHTWSLAPEYTLSALLTLLPAVAVFLAVRICTPEQRLRLARVVLAVALLSLLLAVLQFLSGGNERLYLSPRSIFGSASGIFANRNFQASFLLLGILLATALLQVAKRRRERKQMGAIGLAIIGALALGVVLTQSRFGFLALAAVLGFAALELKGFAALRTRVANARFTIQAIVVSAGVLVAGGLLLVLLSQRLLGPLWSRFQAGAGEAGAEMRVDALPDLLAAVERYSFAGAGLGTFDPVYRGVESLELVSNVFFNHAHNDYIELLIETGAPGLLLALAAVAAVTMQAWQVFRHRRGGPLERAAVAGLALLLLHSLFDYPLRTVTLQCVFAFLAAVAFTRSAEPSHGERPVRAKAPLVLMLVLAGIGGSILIARVGLARHAVSANAGPLAYVIRPHHPRAAALSAQALQNAGNTRAAQARAMAAINAFPIDAVAVRVLGEARNTARNGDGEALLQMASMTGWRDRPTQSWVVERGLLAGNYRVAAMRAEALARVGGNTTATSAFLRILASQPDARAMIVRSLAARPAWRQTFLLNDDPRPPEQLRSMSRLLEELARTGAPPTLEEARPTIDGLVRAEQPEQAFALYRVVVPGRAPTAARLLSDPGFDLPPEHYVAGPMNTVFDWRVFEAGNSFGAVEPVLGETGNTALFIGAAGSDNGRLAERHLLLEPGTYRLAARVRAENAGGTSGLRWVVRCAAGPRFLLDRSLADITGEGWRSYAVAFTVPASGCPHQILGLVAQDVPVGTNPAVMVDDIRLERR